MGVKFCNQHPNSWSPSLHTVYPVSTQSVSALICFWCDSYLGASFSLYFLPLTSSCLLVSCCCLSFLVWPVHMVFWCLGPFGTAWHLSNSSHCLTLVVDGIKSKTSTRTCFYRHYKVRYCVYLRFLFLPHCLVYNKCLKSIIWWMNTLQIYHTLGRQTMS